MDLKRKLSLTLTRGEELLFTSGDLRVDFEVTTSIGNALNTGKFTLYNLSDEFVNGISESTGVDITVKLETGEYYATSLTTLFEGSLVNLHTSPMFEDKITTLWCWAKGVDEIQQAPTKPDTYIKTPLLKVLESILSKVLDSEGNKLYQIDSSSVEASALSFIVQNYTANKSPFNCINELLKEQGLSFTLDVGSVVITPAMLKEGDIERFVANNKISSFIIQPLYLKKPVNFSIAEVDICYALSPSVKPLDVISLDYTSLQTSFSGYGDSVLQIVDGITNILPREYYFTTKVVHRGSLYTEDWDSTISGIIYSNTRGMANG